MYLFGNPSSYDPTSLTEAIGDDAVKASSYGIRNLERIGIKASLQILRREQIGMPAFRDTLTQVWLGTAENDGFNRLVVGGERDRFGRDRRGTPSVEPAERPDPPE